MFGIATIASYSVAYNMSSWLGLSAMNQEGKNISRSVRKSKSSLHNISNTWTNSDTVQDSYNITDDLIR